MTHEPLLNSLLAWAFGVVAQAWPDRVIGMESRDPVVDPLLAKLAQSRGALTVCYRVALGGLCFWLLFLVGVGLQMRDIGFAAANGLLITALIWLLFAVPILAHIWPILALRRAGLSMAAFARAPSDDAAVAAVRAQGRYWRAAAISHLALILWVIADLIALVFLMAMKTNVPA